MNVWKVIQLQLHKPIEGGVAHLINDNEFIYIGGLGGLAVSNKVNLLSLLLSIKKEEVKIFSGFYGKGW